MGDPRLLDADQCIEERCIDAIERALLMRSRARAHDQDAPAHLPFVALYGSPRHTRANAATCGCEELACSALAGRVAGRSPHSSTVSAPRLVCESVSDWLSGIESRCQ